MNKVVYFNDGKPVGEKAFDEIICRHIAGYNKNVVGIVRTYHMGEVIRIREYMMTVFEDTYADARSLNNCFHMAVKELGINLNEMTMPVRRNIKEIAMVL